ncbi:MAG: hypothetical protein A2Y38_10335 [Spirochaetes bacterium GWB1_59_5]|nr:MAG: hypothetical protein A2Y38_10335 [Spirochaetes bacterium GWB1_59_5]
MADHRVDCPVRIPAIVLGGVLANAFRVVSDNTDEYLLDFLDYDPEKDTARVVARVRVRGSVLEAIRDRLQNTLGQIELTEALSLGLSQRS